MTKLLIKKLREDAIIPKYQTEGSACFDLHAALVDDSLIPIEENYPTVIGTGLAFEVPIGFVMLVFSRSGTAFKNDTRLANCVGVIDSDYRGEVKVKLTRDSSDAEPLMITTGDRIAQAMLVALPQVILLESTKLSETDRGEGGLGSTGK